MAASVALAPIQIIPSLGWLPELSDADMAGVGRSFTVIVLVDVALHPLALVTVTVYVAVAVGETEIEVVVAALLQRYDVPPDAEREALAPTQIMPSLLATPEVSVTETDGVGSALTVIVRVVVALHPFSFVTVTV